MTYTHLTADDPSIESFRGIFMKVRRALGTTAFGLNEIRMPPGFRGIEHDESETGHEEVYVVLDGEGVFTIDGEEVGVAAGDYLRVDAAATRIAVAGESGMRFLVIGGCPLPEYNGRESL